MGQMTKEDINLSSLVPPFRADLANWRSFPAPKPKSYSEPGGYGERIATWLKNWDPFNEGVALANYEDGMALMWEGEVQGKNLQQYRRQTIDETVRLELLEWASRVTLACGPVLRALFDRHSISPIAVLDVLGSWKAHFVLRRDALQRATQLRSSKQRRKDAKVLIRAAETLERWMPLCPFAFNVPKYPEAGSIRIIAETLLGFGPPQAYRPETTIKACARELSQLFLRQTSKPLPEYVGKLIRHAFPEEWNPASDIKDAAKKLMLKRRGKKF
jgi:hypothetical protein